MHKSYLWLAAAAFVGTLAGVAAAAYMSKQTASPVATAPAAEG